MHALVEVQVVPIGNEASMRDEVDRAQQALEQSGLTTRVHATGTNVEGEIDDVLGAISDMVRKLHDEGVPRLATTIKIDTRTDKDPSLDDAG